MNSSLAKWRPTDDLLLIESVLQVNNIAIVHACVEFSCRFTLAEIEQRWKTLLYDEVESRAAQEAILALPGSVVHLIKSNGIWTKAEEDVLAGILSTDTPTLETFESMIEEDSSPWKPCRTPQALLHHWELMKKYQLLKDQLMAVDSDHNEEFAEISTILDMASPSPHLLRQMDDKIVMVNEKVEIWQSRLNQTLVETEEFSPNYSSNNKNYRAILCGENMSYFINKTTVCSLQLNRVEAIGAIRVTIGISKCLQPVDIDLSLDGCNNDHEKINCIIRYQDGGFKILNLAELPIIVNDKVLVANTEAVLSDDSEIKIGHCFLTFIDPKVHNAILSNKPPFENFTNLKAPNTQFLRKIAKVGDNQPNSNNNTTNLPPATKVPAQNISIINSNTNNIGGGSVSGPLSSNQQPPPLANFNPIKNIPQSNPLSSTPSKVPTSVAGASFNTSSISIKPPSSSIPVANPLATASTILSGSTNVSNSAMVKTENITFSSLSSTQSAQNVDTNPLHTNTPQRIPPTKIITPKSTNIPNTPPTNSNENT